MKKSVFVTVIMIILFFQCLNAQSLGLASGYYPNSSTLSAVVSWETKTNFLGEFKFYPSLELTANKFYYDYENRANQIGINADFIHDFAELYDNGSMYYGMGIGMNIYAVSDINKMFKKFHDNLTLNVLFGIKFAEIGRFLSPFTQLKIAFANGGGGLFFSGGFSFRIGR